MKSFKKNFRYEQNMNLAQGFAIDTRAQQIINSANALLVPNTGGAGRIREKAAALTKKEELELDTLLEQAPRQIREIYLRKQKRQGWKPNYHVLACLRLLKKNKFKPFKIGTAIKDSNWNKNSKRTIIHAITVSYKLVDNKTKRIKANKLQVQKALEAALALTPKTATIALPIPVARNGFGITPKQSIEAIQKALKKYPRKAIICADNKDTQEYVTKNPL
jgi:O-acetyl-ADP-ribose deacetylase (regulator of RNase III)